jgi:hypothetical protein
MAVMIDDPLLADKMPCQWTGIEHAMEFANGHPAFRPRVESVVASYFDLIDEIAAELESRYMSGNGKIWTM